MGGEVSDRFSSRSSCLKDSTPRIDSLNQGNNDFITIAKVLGGTPRRDHRIPPVAGKSLPSEPNKVYRGEGRGEEEEGCLGERCRIGRVFATILGYFLLVEKGPTNPHKNDCKKTSK